MPELYQNLQGSSTPLPQTNKQGLYESASKWLSHVYSTNAKPLGSALEQHLTAPPLQRPRLENIEETQVFFDVETNGLSKVCLALQLSFLVTRISEKGGRATLEVTDFFDGCFAVPTIAPTAEKIHGISLEYLEKLDQSGQLQHWDVIGPRFLQHCEQAQGLVGHNVAFDIRSITNTLAYHNLPDACARFAALAQQKKQCTLAMARSWTKLTKNAEQRAAKPVSHKLTQLYQDIFGHSMTNAHDAAADTLATAALFYHLKSVGIEAEPSQAHSAKAKLSEPAEVHNTKSNSIAWIVMESNHDRRHIIPKSILRLFVQKALQNAGPQTIAQACIRHPDFPIISTHSLNSDAIASLKAIAQEPIQPGKRTRPEPTEDLENILYLLLKHNRLNYFLGESSWNRAIGAPMRYLRAQEPQILATIDQCTLLADLKKEIHNVFDGLNACLDATHADSSYNVSFEDTRGQEIQQEGEQVIAQIKSSLDSIRQSMINELPTERSTDPTASLVCRSDKKSAMAMIGHLQDSFAFDLSQSHHKDVRYYQNSILSGIYRDIHGAITSRESHKFVATLSRFLGLNQTMIDKGIIRKESLYNQENPVYAARQLEAVINKNPRR